MDFKRYSELLSDSEKQALESKLLARVQEILTLCSEIGRANDEKWERSLRLSLPEGGINALEEAERNEFLSGQTYFERSRTCKREWLDLIDMLSALTPKGNPDSLFFEWDLDSIERVTAARRERQQERHRRIHGIPEERSIDGNGASDAVRRTGAPGRPTGMHLVLSEFNRRAAGNWCEQSALGEARYLAEWYCRVHSGAPPLKPKSIENKIRGPYRAWRERAPQNTPTKL